MILRACLCVGNGESSVRGRYKVEQDFADRRVKHNINEFLISRATKVPCAVLNIVEVTGSIYTYTRGVLLDRFLKGGLLLFIDGLLRLL